MISTKHDAFKYFSQIKGNSRLNKDAIKVCIEVLNGIASSEGLPEDDIDQLVEFLTTTKLASSNYLSLFNCLIPQTKISKKSVEEILLWFFSELLHAQVLTSVEKRCLQWLTGIIYYELTDTTVIESYYHSFLFLLKKPHLESVVCRLLCLISKPEDAKRWVVQQILHIQTVSGPKAHLNSFLSLLKSYRSNVVPESVCASTFCYKISSFDEALSKAHSRSLEGNLEKNKSHNSDNLQWNNCNIYDEKSKNLTRLIPSADILHEDRGWNEKKKLHSIMDFQIMASLGFQTHKIDCPTQTLSLLTNLAGYHVLTFSNMVTKTRFSYKLFHMLCRVFLLELEPYSEKEKIHFLNSVKGLQEYIQQSIPVVTTFLFNYLPIWNGEEYREQVLGLVEWIDVRDEKFLENYVFPSLRQIFISSGTHFKCLLIDTMSKFMRNLLVMDKREKNFFRNDYQECNIVKSIESISSFVSELVVNGLIWNNEESTRNILMTALDFYETCQAVEQAGDLPIIIVMPPILVYSCLFSGSRLCIARLCSLLLRLQTNSVERLYLLGVFQDFVTEVQQLNIYIMDYYRCLWSDVSFCKNEGSFIFNENNFCEVFWKYKEIYGDVMDNIFGIGYNSSFWYPQTKGVREIIISHLAEDYPSIVRLKQVTEERLLQVCSVINIL